MANQANSGRTVGGSHEARALYVPKVGASVPRAAATRRTVLGAGAYALASAAMGGGIVACAGTGSRSVCLPPAEGDTGRFGEALAFADDRLYIGDPGAGRVAIVTRGADGTWRRTGHLAPAEAVPGFGANLATGDAGVLIGALGPGRPEKADGGIYLADPDSGELEVLDRSDANTLVGHALAADGDTLAWTRRARNAAAPVGRIAVEREGHRETLSFAKAEIHLGAGVALSQRTLVAGAPALGANGGAVAFDLDTGAPGREIRPDPSQIDRPNMPSIGWHVAVSPDLAAVSGTGGAVGRALIVSRNGSLAADLVEGSEPVAAAGDRVVFPLPQAVPMEEGTGVFLYRAASDAGRRQRTHLVGEELVRSGRKACAISQNDLAVGWLGPEQGAQVAILSLQNLSGSATRFSVAC